MSEINSRNFKVQAGDRIIVQTPQYDFDNCEAIVKVVHNRLEGTLGVRILTKDVPLRVRMSNPVTKDGLYIPFTVHDGEWIMKDEFEKE